jgi:hypothetical protein
MGVGTSGGCGLRSGIVSGQAFVAPAHGRKMLNFLRDLRVLSLVYALPIERLQMLNRHTDQRSEMKNRWLAMEHYRLQCAELQPDSPYKRATVAAIRSAIESLSSEARPSPRILGLPRRPDRTTGEGHLAA